MILTKKKDSMRLLAGAVYPSADRDPIEKLEGRLIEAGVSDDRIPEVRRIAQDCAFSLAAEMFRHVIRKLDGSPAGVALQAALLGEDNLSATAREVGVSKQAFSVSIKRIQRRVKTPG